MFVCRERLPYRCRRCPTACRTKCLCVGNDLARPHGMQAAGLHPHQPMSSVCRHGRKHRGAKRRAGVSHCPMVVWDEMFVCREGSLCRTKCLCVGKRGYCRTEKVCGGKGGVKEMCGGIEGKKSPTPYGAGLEIGGIALRANARRVSQLPADVGVVNQGAGVAVAGQLLNRHCASRKKPAGMS